MGKFLSIKENNMARHAQEIFNSQVKRGEIDVETFVRTHYVVCGCGAEGCGFIAKFRKDMWPDLELQSKMYQEWLSKNQ